MVDSTGKVHNQSSQFQAQNHKAKPWWKPLVPKALISFVKSLFSRITGSHKHQQNSITHKKRSKKRTHTIIREPAHKFSSVKKSADNSSGKKPISIIERPHHMPAGRDDAERPIAPAPASIVQEQKTPDRLPVISQQHIQGFADKDLISTTHHDNGSVTTFFQGGDMLTEGNNHFLYTKDNPNTPFAILTDEAIFLLDDEATTSSVISKNGNIQITNNGELVSLPSCTPRNDCGEIIEIHLASNLDVSMFFEKGLIIFSPEFGQYLYNNHDDKIPFAFIDLAGNQALLDKDGYTINNDIHNDTQAPSDDAESDISEFNYKILEHSTPKISFNIPKSHNAPLPPPVRKNKKSARGA